MMEAQFQGILTALMSSDNGARRSAEANFDSQIQSNLEQSIETLINIFGAQSCDPVLRSFAGVLLRRAVEKHSGRMTPISTLQMRKRFMEIWASERNPLILNRLSHVMAQSCLKCPWEELIPSVIQYSGNIEASMLIPLLSLIEILSDYCPDDIFKHLAMLGPFLGQFIAFNDARVKIACAKATSACIISLRDDNACNAFKPALDPIVSVLAVALNNGDESDATKIMEYLVSIAQERPVFFKGSLDSIVNAMLSVANATGLEFSTRSMALELLVTIAETAPAMARRCAGLVQGLIPLAMSLMLELEEEEDEWAAGPYTEEPVDDNSAVGDEAIERVAAGMGGKSVSDPVLALVQQFSGMSGSYKHRRAAVAGLCRLAEGSTKHFKKYLDVSVRFLTAALQDGSARVRFEGIQTVGRFAALYPELSSQLIPTFLPLLTMTLQADTTCNRVRGHAASALIDMLNPDNCEYETLRPFLDPLLQSLVFCLQSAPLEVRGPCLTLLGCVAQVCGEDFAPYYTAFMPGIKAVLTEATAPDLTVLRGKAMECAGLVGEAVGVQVFAADAMDIMQLFMHALQLDTDRDTTFDYILPACARISKALTVQFEPFLPMLMDLLLQGAKQDVQFSMVDAEEDDVEGEVHHDEDTGTECAVVSLGAGVKKRVSLSTHAVQQKNQAARILYEFASALRGYLKSYILPSLQILLELVVYKHSSDIRSSAALAVAKMFEAFLHAVHLGHIQDNPAQNVSLKAVLNSCISNLMLCLRDETDLTARACAAEALRDVLQACYQSGKESADGSRGGFALSPELSVSEKLVKEILTRCAESLMRRETKVQSIQKNEGYDAEDRDACNDELEEEEDLLTTFTDTFGQLLKLHGESFMPEFDHFIAPAFSSYLTAEQPEALQVVAIYLVDDVIEFGGQAAHKYIPSLLPTFIRNAQSENVLLRQSSVYGIAKAVFVAPAILAQHLGTVLPCLMSIIGAAVSPSAEGGGEDDDDDEEDDNEGTLENAVFALGTICSEPVYRSALIAAGAGGDVNPLVSLWLQKLPLKTDELQAKIVCKQLCDSIERNDVAILGDNSANLGEIFRVMAEVFQSTAQLKADLQGNPSPNSVALLDEGNGTGSGCDGDALSGAHPETLHRMQGIMRSYFSTNTMAPEVQKAFAALSPELQQAMKRVI